MKPSTSSIALGLLSSSALTLAIRIPVQRRSGGNHGASISGPSPTPGSAATLASFGAGASNDSEIANHRNYFYTTNITIAGMEVPLQLDTGSTDLWVSPEAYPGIFASAHNFSNVPVGVRYGKGSVEGILAVTNVSFAGFDVEDQAFISVTKATDMDSLFASGTYGIMGFGFDTLSNVVKAVNTTYNATWGRSLLSNLFLQDPDTPNHVAFALERAGDLDDMATGSFDIGEIQPQYAAVNQSPAIPLWPETANRWTVLLDAMTVGNNSSVPLNSTFEGDNASDPPAGKSVALLDTGTSLGLIPRWAVDAIYGSITGSAYSAQDDVWFVPCMAEGILSFIFGEVTVPIHPLDLTAPQIYTYQSTGNEVTFCTNSFVPLTSDATPFDFLFGDSFLRNIYAVYDFGDFDASGNMGKPYVKLLSLTEPAAASASFKKNRAATLAQLPAEGDISKIPGTTTPVPPNTSSNVGSGGSGSTNAGASLASSGGASDDDTAVAATLDKLSKLAPIALALIGVNVVLLVGLVAMGVFFIARRNKAQGAAPIAGSSARGVYAPVTKFAEDDERSRTPSGRYDVPQFSS